MHLLPTYLAPLASSCSKENARFGGTTGVNLRVNDDNTFIAEATDCKAAIRVTGHCVDKAADYPSIPALDASPNGECTAIVPAKDWKSAFADCKKLTARACKPILRSLPVVIGKDVTSFGATNLERISFSQPRNIGGQFPALSKVFQEPAKALLSVRVDPSLLASVLNNIDAINPENAVSVDMEFHGANMRQISLIMLRSQSPECKIEGAVMPLTFTDGPCKGKSDGRLMPEETDAPEFISDDEKRLHGAKMLVEELQRKLVHQEERTEYFRNGLEELRCNQPVDTDAALELAKFREIALNVKLETQRAEFAELVRDMTAQRDLAHREIERMQREEQASEKGDLLHRIGELETELECARTEQEAQAGSEMAKMKERMEEAEADVAKLDKEMEATAYSNVGEMVKEINQLTDKVSYMETQRETDGVRLTSAWTRITHLENVNGLLRTNFDKIAKLCK